MYGGVCIYVRGLDEVNLSALKEHSNCLKLEKSYLFSVLETHGVLQVLCTAHFEYAYTHAVFENLLS